MITSNLNNLFLCISHRESARRSANFSDGHILYFKRSNKILKTKSNLIKSPPKIYQINVYIRNQTLTFSHLSLQPPHLSLISAPLNPSNGDLAMHDWSSDDSFFLTSDNHTRRLRRGSPAGEQEPHGRRSCGVVLQR